MSSLLTPGDPNMDVFFDAYTYIVENPRVIFGRILSTKSNQFEILLKYSQFDVKDNNTLSFFKFHTIPNKNITSIPVIPLQENTEFSSISPTGKYFLIVKDIQADPKKNRIAESRFDIFDGDSKLFSLGLKEIHGKLPTSLDFQNVNWSQNLNEVVYVAEQKEQERKKFWDKNPLSSKPTTAEDKTANDSSEKKKNIPFSYFEFKESFGEGLSDTYLTKIFKLNLLDRKIVELPLPKGQDSFALACPTCLNSIEGSIDGVVYLAYSTEDRKLGITYCIQRKNQCYFYSYSTGKLEKILEDEWNVLSPTFTNNAKKELQLVYMTTGKVVEHFPPVQLKVMDWNTKTRIQTIQPENSLALFSSPSDRVFRLKSDHIVIEILHQSQVHVALIQIGTGKVLFLEQLIQNYLKSLGVNNREEERTTMSLQESSVKFASWSLFDVNVEENLLLVNLSSLTCPYHVLLCHLSEDSSSILSVKDVVMETKLSRGILQKMEMSIRQSSRDGIEYIVFGPKSSEDILSAFLPGLKFDGDNCEPLKKKMKMKKLVVNPHGGPHGMSSTMYRADYPLYAMFGFSSMMVNYRGSVGYSNEFMSSLLGHIGDYDVKDVQNCVEEYSVSFDRVFCSGGSHGGFLCGHLIGQYPDFYKAGAVLHNAVINVASMLSTTDIPDWCLAEVGFDPFANGSQMIPSKDFLEKALQMSPIVHVNNVKCPVLLLVGYEDLRVPSQQSKEFYFALRSKAGREAVKMLTYKGEGHPIGGVQSTCDRVLSSLIFFINEKL